jgi:SAM-dependent methyltransferase
MSGIKRKEISDRLEYIRTSYEDEIVRLKTYPINSERVLNIGCANGNETLALMWFLEANVACGVDKKISNARTLASDFKRDLDDTIRSITDTPIPEEIHLWWETSVPLFLREGKFPFFIEADIASKADFGPLVFVESFSFAYCSSVLCHVHKNQGPIAIRSAIESIYSVLETGACFIANEPPDEELKYFELELSRVGFQVSRQSPYGRIEYRCYLP